MGARGPNPVDVEQLKRAAKGWATLLFALRSGAHGVVERWERSLIVECFSPKKEQRKTEAWLRKLENDGWQVYRPIFPSVETWEKLKRDRPITRVSIKEARKAIAALRRWRHRELSGLGSDDVLRALESDPCVLLHAKRLPHYPKEAKTDDDKRVLFLAKVLAGLEMGLAPLTTTRKLSHWRCENYWKTVGVQYVDSFKSALRKGARQ